MIYKFIKNHETIYPIEKMCKVLSIGLRSYYDWKSNTVSERKLKAIAIQKEIKTIYFKRKQQYGSPPGSQWICKQKGLRFPGLQWLNI